MLNCFQQQRQFTGNICLVEQGLFVAILNGGNNQSPVCTSDPCMFSPSYILSPIQFVSVHCTRTRVFLSNIRCLRQLGLEKFSLGYRKPQVFSPQDLQELIYAVDASMVCTFKHSILLNFSPSTFSPDKLGIYSSAMFVQYWSALPEPPLPTLSDSIFQVERRGREKCPFIYLVSKVMQIQSGLQEIPPPLPHHPFYQK